MISPYTLVSAGSYLSLRPLRVHVVSSRRATDPVDQARLWFPRREFPAEIQPSIPITVTMGFRGGSSWPVFNGNVRNMPSDGQGDLVQLRCSDPMGSLAKLNEIMVAPTPQDIIRRVLAASGRTVYQLTQQQLNPVPRYSCVGQGHDIIAGVATRWGLKDFASYFRPDGSFSWGPWTESPESRETLSLVLRYGRNLADHRILPDGTGRLETAVLPMVHHSMQVQIEDSRWWTGTRTVRVDRVEHIQEPNRARTVIEWSPLPT